MAIDAPSHVPFVDLAAQYSGIKAEIDAAVLGCFESAEFVLGSHVQAFEARFAAYAQARHAVGVNSGTSALHLALLAAGVGPGDEVITSAHTFIATAAAIDYCGAVPVLVDIDPVSFTIDPAGVAAAVTARTRAIVPVHLYGQMADMGPLVEIAAAHGVAVVEDAAQAHGAEYFGRRAGSLGLAGCFSFYPGKNLGAYGEGGAITCHDDGLAQQLRTLRDWGATRKYHHEVKGFNYRLDGVQGAVLGVKMAHIEAWTDQRRAIARRYDEGLAASAVRTPQELPGRRHVYHVYAIRTAEREHLRAFLAERGIATGIHYPVPVHLQPAFAELGHGRGDFPHTESAAAEVLSLPMFPELTPEQQCRVVGAILEWSER